MAETFIDRMAERIGSRAGVQAAFGTPVERDGVTIVPVARVRWGLGGGAGAREGEEGSGGGAGVVVSPIGYLEIAGGRARYRHIRGTGSIVALVAGGLALAVLVTRWLGVR